LLVFLAPLFILFMAWGCQTLVTRGSKYTKAAYVLPLLLLLTPLVSSAASLVDASMLGEKKYAEEREGLLHINQNYQEGDLVYVFWNMEHAYRYYSESYNLKYTAINGLDVKNASQN